jgi:hypothetical protein
MSSAFHHLTGGYFMVPWARVTSADELMSSAIYRPANISLHSQHPQSQTPRDRDTWCSLAPYRDFKATASECRLRVLSLQPGTTPEKGETSCHRPDILILTWQGSLRKAQSGTPPIHRAKGKG